MFFRLVPLEGLDNIYLNNSFGFLWNRFLPRAYWWETVDLIRKIGLVLIEELIDDPLQQSLAGASCVVVVMASSFAVKPFIRVKYNKLDAFGASTQLLVFMLGISVYVRGLLGGSAKYEQPLLATVFIVYGVFMAWFFLFDLQMWHFDHRVDAERERSAASVRDMCTCDAWVVPCCGH